MVIDEKVIRLAIKGDKDSFAKVYDFYAPDLYRVAMYTLSNAFDAEDVVSEAFVEAYKGIKNLREPSKIKAWLMRILSIRCNRKIAEYIKSRGESNVDDISFMLADNRNISLDTIHRTDLMQALDSLSEEERLIISLSTIEGYTVREVSEILDKPQGTVSSRLYRALDKLRSIIPEDY